MSDRRLSGFDVDTIAAAVRQPPLGELRSVAHFRRRRSGALGATALVVLAALVATPLASRSAQFGSADPPGPTLPGRAGDFTLTGPASGVDVRVATCVLRFSRTVDGGRTWTDWDDARYRAADCEPGPARSGKSLEYAVLSDRTYLVDDDGVRRLSTDYGRTWRDAEQAITAVGAFPPAARPVPRGLASPAVTEPLAVDPSTGDVYRLSGQPPSPLALAGVYPASDGSIWTTYGINGTTVGARSADRGATWNTWTPAAGRTVLALAGVDRRVGYQIVADADGAVTLERTQDGGTTWSTTVTGLPEVTHWDLTVGSDGSLLAVTQTGAGDHRVAEVRVSRDDGRSLAVARAGGMPVASVSVAPGYAWLFGRDDGRDGEADHLVLTRDGQVWTRILLASS
ncbi:WD40/YVTN/BNR-like repeat-containing protein [Micromonospora aurantiaca]|uniref:WD40/YVTN/BNR-like repeat-containing protein n=1 Tax=Micromonospora aurantiaca (nom. illeg.) TaxID=47850 RepID=UPI00382C8C66